MRINKYLASCGVCSRREADRIIEAGHVMIEGKTAFGGEQVEEGCHVTVYGKPISLPKEHVVLAYYKPVGVTCTTKDSHAKRTVIQEIGYKRRVTYAGRLDQDSEGLLLLTDDGDLINAMMRGINGHEKEYIVKVNKELSEDDLQAFRDGIYLPELKVKTRPCQVEKTGKYTMVMTLTQGLNRQIRRMCKERGYQVKQLKRVRVLNVLLENLKPGEYRELSGGELELLYHQCEMR